jgi:pimeloyl-ACP methyl ester carboxylesterase
MFIFEPKPIFMKRFLLFCFIFTGFSFSSLLQAQNEKELQPVYFTTRIHYLDNTPALFSTWEAGDYLGIVIKKSHIPYGARISDVHQDTLRIYSILPKQYLFTFLDTTLLTFDVKKDEKGQLVSNLPPVITFPFNFILKAPKNSRVMLYTAGGKKLHEFKADTNGYIFLRETPGELSDKIFVLLNKNNFPSILPLSVPGNVPKGSIKRRLMKIRSLSTPVAVKKSSHSTYQDNATVVHNLQTDTFYKIAKISLHQENHLWLLVFQAKTQKCSVHPLKIAGNLKQLAFDLYLNDRGRPVIVVAQQNPKTYEYTKTSYLLSDDGTMTPLKDTHYPFYKFKNNYFDGPRWIIPTFMGIALQPGMHSFKVTCKGKNDQIKTAVQNFEVKFSPEDKYLWRITKPGDTVSFLPDGLPPNNDLQSIDLKECTLSVDGSAPLAYDHQDEERLKSLAYADWENDADREKAMKSVPVIPGLGPDANVWNSELNLFPFHTMTNWPDNLWEGPYPHLRYHIQRITEKYTTLKEARQHCKKVKKYYGQYACVKDKMVAVCPEHYNFSITDGKVKTDSSLYCSGTEKPVVAGHPVSITVYAKGYRPKTLTLDKTTLDLSEIHLHGIITDSQGKPVENAKIHINGFEFEFNTGRDGHYKLDAKTQGQHPLYKELNIHLDPIQIEISNKTLGVYEPDKNFGLVADGFTTLKLHIKTNGINPSSIRVEPPALGDFAPQDSLNTPLRIDKNGEGDMEYVPPAYLKNSFLTRHLQIKEADKGEHGLSGDLWAVDIPISLSYEDKDGNPGTFIFHIKVCRPPVMLVHGFTGDETTWEHLAVQLRHDKYDAIIREYYHGTPEQSSIETQAQKLDFYIRELRKAYLHNGIIQNRVDIVAHSMGGLISRYYISNMPKYGNKSGLAIPYGIRLSRAQLKQFRYKKPVILNTVRKLIMVGTPNHGSSFLDERLGALNALRNDVHQIANEEMRYDSPFLARLNAGESEGRHLDPNVQYALIYGLRRRSQIYPLDNILYPVQTAARNLAPDDGVVSKTSAMLNGVKSYAFPSDTYKYSYGYIHSPILAKLCMGDASLTTDQKVFDKIEELLQEDIPRVPLKNSATRIIHAEGQLFMRYYATQKWIQLRTPITYLQPKRLTYNFCRLKTGDGTATLGFFLNGHQWGGLMVQPHTVLYYEYGSPEYVRIYLQQGKARFRSKKQDGGGFEVVMGDKTGEKWYAFNPKARVKDLNTDFIVEQDSVLNVESVAGKIILTLPPASGKKPVKKSISDKEGFLVSPTGVLTEHPLPDSGWWSHIDTTFLPDFIYDSARFMLPDNAVHITFSQPYLPVSGFSTLKIQIDSLSNDSIRRNYHVLLRLKNANRLPFITITNPKGNTDSLGIFKSEITFREPAPGDYKSLGEIPLKAILSIQIFRQASDTMVFSTDTIVPLGMTLLSGQTTGPGFQPRKEPPPQLNQVIYQIASESDSTGRFYVLFNTTSYDKNRKQLEKLSESSRQSAAQQLEHFVLQWTPAGMFPLTYQLDSLKNALLPGQKILLGKNGKIDILSPPEQELRVKNLMKDFILHMPLVDSSRQYLMHQLDSLDFRYESPVAKPVWIRDENTIAIPQDNHTFWNLDKKNHTEAFHLICRAMGHFLSENLCNRQGRSFHFLQSQDTGKMTTGSFFNEQAYRSFYRTEGEFFDYQMENFLKNERNKILSASMFYRDVDTSAFNKGTHFLIKYYGNHCSTEPARTFADFLFTGMLYASLTDNRTPAGTLNEWLLAQTTYRNNKYIIKTGNPESQMRQQKLFSVDRFSKLIPFPDYVHNSLRFKGQTLTDFREIPEITIDDTSRISILKGTFLLFLPGLHPAGRVNVTAESIFKIENDTLFVPLNGRFTFSNPVPVRKSNVRFTARSNNYTLSTDAKHTVLNVYEGSVELKNDKVSQVVRQGETASVNKNGSIKKPRPMKDVTPPETRAKMKFPFVYRQANEK